MKNFIKKLSTPTLVTLGVIGVFILTSAFWTVKSKLESKISVCPISIEEAEIRNIAPVIDRITI